jgi:hypothetical protein
MREKAATSSKNQQIQTGKASNLSVYRLCDNYMRFALKYILPNQMLIEKGRFQDRSLKSLPGWDTILGLQFENLVLRNHKQDRLTPLSISYLPLDAIAGLQ